MEEAQIFNSHQDICRPEFIDKNQLYGQRPYSRVHCLPGGSQIEWMGYWEAGNIYLPSLTHHRIIIHGLGLGKGYYRTDFGVRDYDIQSGRVVLYPAGSPLEANWSQAQSSSLSFLFPHSELSQVLTECNKSAKGLEVLHGVHEVDQDLLFLVSRLMEVHRTPGVCGPLVKENLQTLILSSIIERYTNRSVLEPKAKHADKKLPSQVIQRTIEYMKANLGSSLNLEELARVAGVSRFHFSRMFKNATGTSPYQYLLHLRVERARQLISSHRGELELSGLALECGFLDQSHLNRHFKKRSGISLGDFCKRCRKSSFSTSEGGPGKSLD